jgi:hypothetical protein
MDGREHRIHMHAYEDRKSNHVTSDFYLIKAGTMSYMKN